MSLDSARALRNRGKHLRSELLVGGQDAQEAVCGGSEAIDMLFIESDNRYGQGRVRRVPWVAATDVFENTVPLLGKARPARRLPSCAFPNEREPGSSKVAAEVLLATGGAQVTSP